MEFLARCRIVSPDENLVEHLWEELREKYLHGRIFPPLDLLVDELCRGLNELDESKTRLTSMWVFLTLMFLFRTRIGMEIVNNPLEQAAKRALAQIVDSQDVLKALYLQPDRAVFLAENSRIVLKVYVEGDILQHEYTVARKVQAAGVPIPEIILFERAQCTIFAMRYVVGIPLTSKHTFASKEAGSYMQCFHNIRGYRPYSGDRTAWDDFVVRWSKYGIDNIERLGLFSKNEITALKEKFATISSELIRRPAAALIHSDLRAEHIIIDHHTQKVLAFLDFADARIGDPLLDFAVISLWDKKLANALMVGYSGIENTMYIQQLISSYRLLRHVVELPWLLSRNLKENVNRHIVAIRQALEE